MTVWAFATPLKANPARATGHPFNVCDLPEIRAMGLFKPDLFRSLAIGFAVGAVIVFGALGIDPGRNLANGVAPPAEAAAAK